MNNTYTKSNSTSHINFDVIIDNSFNELLDTEKESILLGSTKFNSKNKYLLSIINDFETGKWRIERFFEFLYNNIKEIALSFEEREALIDEPYSSLTKARKKLRNIKKEDSNAGEIGEILLYGIMKKYYSALSLVPKIFYKQNTNDFAKGVDSVHITINGDDVDLWFGESKFYKDIDEAIREACKSVLNNLSKDKLEKEKSLIYNYKDLEDMHSAKKIEDEPYHKIKEILKDDTSLDKMKPYLHIPVLILYECGNTKCITEISDEYIANIKSLHFDKAKKYFEEQDKALINNYFREVKIHLILFPVPSSKEIKEYFLNWMNQI